jgi:hypothetical protein
MPIVSGINDGLPSEHDGRMINRGPVVGHPPNGAWVGWNLTDRSDLSGRRFELANEATGYVDSRIRFEERQLSFESVWQRDVVGVDNGDELRVGSFDSDFAGVTTTTFVDGNVSDVKIRPCLQIVDRCDQFRR